MKHTFEFLTTKRYINTVESNFKHGDIFVILDCWRQFVNLIQDINGGRGAGKGELSWF